MSFFSSKASRLLRGSDFYTDVDEECCWCGKNEFAADGVQAMSIISCECCRNVYIHLGCLVRSSRSIERSLLLRPESVLNDFILNPLFRRRRRERLSSLQRRDSRSSSGAVPMAARTCLRASLRRRTPPRPPWPARLPT